MGLHTADLLLYVDTDEDNNPRLQTTAPAAPDAQSVKLSDFSHNYINLKHITVLQISNCIINEIPNSIQKLNLKQLIITRTKLEEIPSCLYSGFPSLELLDLSHNLIKNFHVEPACSSQIVKLNVSNNKMDDFPLWVLTGWCPKLREVYYSGNRVKKLEAPQEMTFRKLEMCNSQLRNVDFLFLKKIKSLEVLDIGNDESKKEENRFKDINLLFTRFRWKKMKTLKLNNLVLSVFPPGLCNVTSLTELHLVGNDLHWIPDEIRFLTNLKILDCSKNCICSLPECLTFLEHLSVVRAPWNHISSVEEFYNTLEVLDLYNNHLEKFLPCVERIKYIDLEENYFDTIHLPYYEVYKIKRDEFRDSFLLQRSEGPIELPEEIESELGCGGDLSFDEVSEKSSSKDYDFSPNEENWDEEPPINGNSQRNPEITPSDDEWNGREEIRIRRAPVVSQFDANEDWIFCDADESDEC